MPPYTVYADLNVQRYNLAEIKIWKPHRSTIAFGLTVLVVNEEITFLTQNNPILITSTYVHRTSSPKCGRRNHCLKYLGSLLTTFFFAFSRKIHEFQHFLSCFAEFFPPRQITLKIISRIADKSPTKQNIGQRPWLVAKSAVHHESLLCPVDSADSPTRRDQHEIASYFLVVDGFVARQVVYSYAREARSPL